MNIYDYLFLIVIFSVLSVTGVLLISFISGNFRNGQRLREGLYQRMGMLRMKKMLVKREVNVGDYLHKSMISDIERDIRVCENCNRITECDAALCSVKATDLSFCPNDTEFRKVKTKLSGASV